MGRHAVMVRQEFNVRHYWKVIIYYDVGYGFLGIMNDLMLLGMSSKKARSIIIGLLRKDYKAVTCSNLHKHFSIVLFGKHDSIPDYINSIVHEAEHIKQHMLKAYHVEDSEEPPAYTIGYLAMRMWPVFKGLICP